MKRCRISEGSRVSEGMGFSEGWGLVRPVVGMKPGHTASTGSFLLSVQSDIPVYRCAIHIEDEFLP